WRIPTGSFAMKAVWRLACSRGRLNRKPVTIRSKQGTGDEQRYVVGNVVAGEKLAFAVLFRVFILEGERCTWAKLIRDTRGAAYQLAVIIVAELPVDP